MTSDSDRARGRRSRTGRRLAVVFAFLAAGTAGAGAAAAAAAPANAAPYDPHRVIVKFASGTAPAVRMASFRAAGALSERATASRTRVLTLPANTTVSQAIARLRHERGIVFAEPDYVAHAADLFVPNDPGSTAEPAGWEKVQWNFVGPFGVNALQAWANVAAKRRYGGLGVTVAVLDTGVAYANRGRFRRSPDFGPHQFVRGYDFVDNNPFPNDHNGHGTHVAGTIAEATNNGVGLTGLAYNAKIMPVRVLDSHGDGDASAIAAGVRYAVNHHAQIVNLSLEFTSDVTAASIPDLIGAIRYAYRRGVLVVAAAGNEGRAQLAFPARARHVLSVGATTEHGCLSDFSNDGPGLQLVAPGGGADAPLTGDPNCHADQPPGHDIFQETFIGTSVRRFGVPSGYEGTSMATPHVSAIAALVIASGVLGPHPLPAALMARLKATARKLGDARHYGAGLVDGAAATAPGGPGAISGGPPTTAPATNAPATTTPAGAHG
jgi:serine protease